MANYLTMELENVRITACIEISCKSTGTPPGTITKVVLKRRPVGYTQWITVGEKAISSMGDFTFTAHDYNAKSLYTYEYIAMCVQGTVEVTGITAIVKSEFDGFFIGDSASRYVCNLNPKIDFQPNGETGEVRTLGSKYAFIVDNSIVDYESGTASGLFLPVICNADYAKVASTSGSLEYKLEVIAWLKNRMKKVLKTHDGHMWYVRIKNRPSEIRSDYLGASEISFEWVEVGEPPNTGVVFV